MADTASISNTFSACIQLYDTIVEAPGEPHQQQQQQQQQLAKLKVEKLRLLCWGEAAGLSNLSPTNTFTPETLGAVSTILARIQHTFFNIAAYGLAEKPATAGESSGAQKLWQWLRGRRDTQQPRWSPGDEQRFNKLVLHLQDSNDRLRELVPELSMRTWALVEAKIRALDDVSGLQLVEAAVRDTHPDISEIARACRVALESQQQQNWDMCTIDDFTLSRHSSPASLTLEELELESSASPSLGPIEDSDLWEDPLMYADMYGANLAPIIVAQRTMDMNRVWDDTNTGLAEFGFKRVVVELRHQNSRDVAEMLTNITPVGSNIADCLGCFEGPAGTPYQGGVFFLSIHFGANYPFRAPRVRFLTKVYHPNISDNGVVCLDLLGNEWRPGLKATAMLLSICSLLSDPNPKDPMMPEIAELFLHNRRRYDAMARLYTTKYATVDQISLDTPWVWLGPELKAESHAATGGAQGKEKR